MGPRKFAALLFGALVVVTACKPSTSGGAAESVPPTFQAAVAAHDALAVSQALESLIDAEKDSREDRQFAYDTIQGWDDGSPAYAFARAAIAGRLVEKRGLQAGDLVAEVESYCMRARAADPDYREGAATRMLGTLYVLAPGRLLKHGDSEKGLEILEGEAEAHPERVEGRLRLAEAYIAFGEAEPAFPHLCAAIAGESKLGAGDRRLLKRLIDDAGGEAALGCAGGAS